VRDLSAFLDANLTKLSSTLRERAKELGQEIPDGVGNNSVSATQNIINAMPLSEAWDIIDAMKKLIDEDRSTARNVLEAYPQLVFAMYEIQVCSIICLYIRNTAITLFTMSFQRRLGVVTTAASTSAAPVPPGGPIPEFIVPDLLQQGSSHAMPYYNAYPDSTAAYADPNAMPMEAYYQQGGYPGSDANAYYQSNDQPPVLFNDPPEPAPFSWG
jgi:hypothetical protein